MNPVFIGGCGRSGTTLLGAILGSHSDCLTLPEFQFKLNIIQACNNRNHLHTYANEILKDKRFKIWKIKVDADNLQKNLAKSAIHTVNFFVKEYAESINFSKSPKLWIDHTPANMKYAKTLLEVFPQAKFVHIVRDGRAVASSVIPLDWGPNTITKAASWWVEHMAYGLAAESFLGKDKIIRIKYEDLISKPKETVKNLCSYLDIEYQHSMLDATGFKVPSYTAVQHNLIGKRLDATRLNDWEKKLSFEEVEIFEILTGDFLNYLNYSLKSHSTRLNIHRVDRVKFDIKEVYIQQVNKIRNRLRFYKSQIHNLN